MRKLAVFASGSGTNAENLIKYFHGSDFGEVVAVFCNKPRAAVIRRAEKLKVPAIVFDRVQMNDSDAILRRLASYQVDMIILAGFLWLIPKSLLLAYPKSIINIHPALLPKFGGKGMYGDRVHKAVIESKETKSGITIHLIDDEYDKGQNLAQIECMVTENETHESLASKIHELEYEYFPKVIEQYIKDSQESQ